MDRFQRGTEQQRRFFVARRPAAFAIDALPRDLELLVDQDNRLGAAASGTTHAMFVEHVMNRQSSLHVRLVGSYNPVR
jgi:hypothetical protein